MKLRFPRFRRSSYRRGPRLKGSRIERELTRADKLARRMRDLNSLMVNL